MPYRISWTPGKLLRKSPLVWTEPDIKYYILYNIVSIIIIMLCEGTHRKSLQFTIYTALYPSYYYTEHHCRPKVHIIIIYLLLEFLYRTNRSPFFFMFILRSVSTASCVPPIIHLNPPKILMIYFCRLYSSVSRRSL